MNQKGSVEDMAELPALALNIDAWVVWDVHTNQ